MKKKYCNICNRLLPLDDFGYNSAKQDKKQLCCKVCINTRSRATSAVNNDKSIPKASTQKCCYPGCGKNAQVWHHVSYVDECKKCVMPLCKHHHRAKNREDSAHSHWVDGYNGQLFHEYPDKSISELMRIWRNGYP